MNESAKESRSTLIDCYDGPIASDLPNRLAGRFHELGHTAATLLLGKNIHPKIVSEMLGHCNVYITLDIYSHVTPTMQREAARAMGALLPS